MFNNMFGDTFPKGVSLATPFLKVFDLATPFLKVFFPKGVLSQRCVYLTFSISVSFFSMAAVSFSFICPLAGSSLFSASATSVYIIIWGTSP